MKGKPTSPRGCKLSGLSVETGNNFQGPGVPVGAGLHLLCLETFKIHEGGGGVFNLINAEFCPEGIPAPQGLGFMLSLLGSQVGNVSAITVISCNIAQKRWKTSKSHYY